MAQWLAGPAWIALGVAFLCAAWLIVEQFRHRQHAWIMYLVWPITALYMGPVALWTYYTMGLSHNKPFWQGVVVDATHCGAGCSLGDVISEFALFYSGFVFAGSMFKSALIMDFIAAFILGIAFQYFAIAQMSGVPGMPSLRAALKADTLSLTAFEIGLFGWMAIFQLVLFPGIMPNQAAYWFMMQIGMCLGFITSYPANWWLIKRGIKMGM